MDGIAAVEVVDPGDVGNVVFGAVDVRRRSSSWKRRGRRSGRCPWEFLPPGRRCWRVWRAPRGCPCAPRASPARLRDGHERVGARVPAPLGLGREQALPDPRVRDAGGFAARFDPAAGLEHGESALGGLVELAVVERRDAAEVGDAARPSPGGRRGGRPCSWSPRRRAGGHRRGNGTYRADTPAGRAPAGAPSPADRRPSARSSWSCRAASARRPGSRPGS